MNEWFDYIQTTVVKQSVEFAVFISVIQQINETVF